MTRTGWLVFLGSVAFVLGLLSLNLPYVLAALLLMPTGGVAIARGLFISRASAKELLVPGGIVVAFGVCWTVLSSYLFYRSLATCVGCLSPAPLIEQPEFWSAISVLALGSSMIAVVAMKRQRVRKLGASNSQATRSRAEAGGPPT